MAAAPGLTSRANRAWRRFDGPARLVGIDLARGLAVLGMFAAHLLTIEEAFAPDDPATWLDVVNGRSSILFATLAGLSIALVTGGPRPLEGPARTRASARLAMRGGLLWGIGILLVMTGVPVYVILPAYALLFALSLPFLGLRSGRLFLAAAIVAVVMPWIQPLLDAAPIWSGPAGDDLAAFVGWHYPFPVWIAFLLAGMGVGRLDLQRVRVQVLVAVVGIVVSALGYGLALVARPGTPYLAAVLTAEAHSSGLGEVIGSGGFAIAVIGLCLLVCRTPVRWVAIPLRAVGSMPLTAYVAHIVVWAVLAAAVLGDTSDLSGVREAGLFLPLAVGIVVGCTAWALLVGRGPLEAVIDGFVRRVVGPPTRPDATPPAAAV
ncbi:heparan-alpha-glucosaminide N-acetyltransferase domain-containing protein [Microbacterium sp. B19]|uniref:heparan-alpha-glucosaminide N-acetyltransferase domain-containing protein n=1 Tax=Microbacterium sp. B19 TaxID=96765 RepID=UPI0003B783FF|nr:heparan-alpha-glucosaminide N-acetyltransferase domain-containing protein [Microbacterium sp. B19]